MRNHNLGFECLSKLFVLIEEEQDEALASTAARALAIIAEGDGEGVLSKANHAVLRVRITVCDPIGVRSFG